MSVVTSVSTVGSKKLPSWAVPQKRRLNCKSPRSVVGPPVPRAPEGAAARRSQPLPGTNEVIPLPSTATVQHLDHAPNPGDRRPRLGRGVAGDADDADAMAPGMLVGLEIARGFTIPHAWIAARQSLAATITAIRLSRRQSTRSARQLRGDLLSGAPLPCPTLPILIRTLRKAGAAVTARDVPAKDTRASCSRH
jgi:hypothetical protein